MPPVADLPLHGAAPIGFGPPGGAKPTGDGAAEDARGHLCRRFPDHRVRGMNQKPRSEEQIHTGEPRQHQPEELGRRASRTLAQPRPPVLLVHVGAGSHEKTSRAHRTSAPDLEISQTARLAQGRPSPGIRPRAPQAAGRNPFEFGRVATAPITLIARNPVSKQAGLHSSTCNETSSGQPACISCEKFLLTLKSRGPSFSPGAFSGPSGPYEPRSLGFEAWRRARS